MVFDVLSYLQKYDSKIILQNKYFESIIDSTMNKNDFVKSQENFSNCVNYWSQILGLLVFKLGSFKDRRIILENLNDEHFGDENTNPISHVETFIKLIKIIGGTTPTIYDSLTTKFNSNLLESSEKSLPVFIATLGFIEFYYQTISTVIASYIYKTFDGVSIHYHEHEELDNKHYIDLFMLLINYDETTIKKSLEEGNKLAFNAFNDYYNSVFAFYIAH